MDWDKVAHSCLVELFFGQAVFLLYLWRTLKWGIPIGRQICILSNQIIVQIKVQSEVG